MEMVINYYLEKTANSFWSNHKPQFLFDSYDLVKQLPSALYSTGKDLFNGDVKQINNNMAEGYNTANDMLWSAIEDNGLVGKYLRGTSGQPNAGFLYSNGTANNQPLTEDASGVKSVPLNLFSFLASLNPYGAATVGGSYLTNAAARYAADQPLLNSAKDVGVGALYATPLGLSKYLPNLGGTVAAGVDRAGAAAYGLLSKIPYLGTGLGAVPKYSARALTAGGGVLPLTAAANAFTQNNPVPSTENYGFDINQFLEPVSNNSNNIKNYAAIAAAAGIPLSVLGYYLYKKYYNQNKKHNV